MCMQCKLADFLSRSLLKTNKQLVRKMYHKLMEIECTENHASKPSPYYKN